MLGASPPPHPGDEMAPTSSKLPPANDPKVRLYAKHGLLTRTLHWLNMVATLALISTGIAMMIGGEWLRSLGGSIHEVFYLLLLGVGAIYLVSLIASRGWKIFLPTRETIADAAGVVKSELGIGTHAPRLAKYNGAQRLAYLAVLLMVAGEVVTGLAMAYRDQVPWLAAALGGRHTVRGIHKFLMFGIVAFVLVHVVQVMRAGWPTLRAMISGYAIVPAGAAAAIDGATPEPDRLGAPIPQSAANATLASNTRKGFIGAGAALAAGLLLAAVGGAREAVAEGGEGIGPRSPVTAGGTSANGDGMSANGAGAPLNAAASRRRERRRRTGGDEGYDGDGDD